MLFKVKAILFTFFCFSMYFSTIPLMADDDNDNEPVSAISHGQPGIHIEQDLQILSGIETVRLQMSEQQTEYIAYGTVINVSALLKTRAEYITSAAQTQIAETKLKQEKQNLKRINQLHKNKAASTRKQQQAYTSWQIANAEYNSKYYQLFSLQQTAKLTFGETISAWLLAPQSTQLPDFMTKHQSLLQITLTPAQSLPPSVQSVAISVHGNRAKTSTARFISASPQTAPDFQGNSYFFQTDTPIPSGTHITAWIPKHDSATRGILIPASAVIYHLGQPYIYLKTDTEFFTRKKMTDLHKINHAYFTQHDLKANDDVVIQGAQMLLSEEFRSQIPDEDDDD